LGTNHHEEIIYPDSALLVESISKILDQPFADSSIVPTYLLSKFARESTIVALGGDGGDEVFGGYDRYLATPILQHLNLTHRFTRAGLGILSRNEIGRSRKISRLGSQLSPKNSLASRYSSIMSLNQSLEFSKLINPAFNSVGRESDFLNRFNEGLITPLDRMTRSDMSDYLPGDLLVKSDLASMANSLELRSPFLDFSVVEWGVSLPSRYKIKGFETKHILKDVARSLVPPELIDRPKMGFGIPRAEWLRTGMKDMVMDFLTVKTSSQRGWFNPLELKDVIQAHMNGQDRDTLIWPILMIELWARNWLD
jgi:asparagine synthase (glutamine-hydrolysing)